MSVRAAGAPESGAGEPILRLRGVAKRYGGVSALGGVDLDILPGEVLALCGDNGAGKSTLVRIVSGAETPDAGEVLLRGRPAAFRSPHDALEKGVATIHQHLALAPRLSIWENVFMGAELRRRIGPVALLDKARMRREAKGYLARLSVGIEDMGRPIEGLSGGQRQAVAISRALLWNAELIIMDEPTAALGVKETAQVLGLIRALKGEGRTILLVSHNMADVVSVADRVAILRAGRKVADRPVAGLAPEDLSRIIITGEAA